MSTPKEKLFIKGIGIIVLLFGIEELCHLRDAEEVGGIGEDLQFCES